MRSRPEIFLVGLGLSGMRHVTQEVMHVLEEARLVQHLTSKDGELRMLNPRVEDLSSLYWREGQDKAIYAEIAEHVVATALAGDAPLAFVTDGHPMVFNNISWEIVRLGQQKGAKTHALPGVSSIDVLLLQLGFDPGDIGLQVFEATQLVLYGLAMNAHLSTLILQVAEFGMGGILDLPSRVGRHDPLVRHLERFFPADHPAVFILAPEHKEESTIVLRTVIGKIGGSTMRRGMTLYIPRLSFPTVRDSRLLRRLNI